MAKVIQPKSNGLWTSAEVAQAFRVGVSSIKRWTDEGELEAVKTPGNHRRYTLAAVHRFARIRGLSTDHLPELEDPAIIETLPEPADITLFEALRRGSIEMVRRMATPKDDSLAKRAAFFDRVVGDALREIGVRWDRGELGIEEEHRASYLIAEVIDRQRPPAVHGEDVALLCCPPNEHHEIPLRLVRLFLEWSGFRTDFRGANMPWPSLRRAMEQTAPRFLLLTSRTSEAFESIEFDRLAAECRARGTTVIAGGDWARGGVSSERDYLRFRSLRGFERWLRSVRRSPRASAQASRSDSTSASRTFRAVDADDM